MQAKTIYKFTKKVGDLNLCFLSCLALQYLIFSGFNLLYDRSRWSYPNMAIAFHHFKASMKYQARIFVTLRPSVLDPAGTAVQSALKQMDYHVDSVRIGKYVEIVLEATDEAEASQRLDETCDKLLANPVIENYRFELTAIAESKS